MADVTVPISTLPGARHEVPDGTMCDDHPDRLAVARVQGDTDSFGSEMFDLCQECLDKWREEAKQDTIGYCDWCKAESAVRPTRDYDEGLAGRVYYVCTPCYDKQQAAIRAEADQYDYGYFDFDDEGDECWNCGGEGYYCDCFDEWACVDPDGGCDECTRTCGVCKGKGVLS